MHTRKKPPGRALDAVRLALPTLSRSGSVTLTSGAAAFHGGTGRLLGATVSGALIAAGRSLAAELAPSGGRNYPQIHTHSATQHPKGSLSESPNS
ncbi:Rossmann-fold NAD(P)-binding domain-containing protein [Actinacidiphila oryziradicis]|uniref:Uncharacterized protein n=1 Tax=Actinacidiphila oryziradicis TaxID=2571141 RepID=A0A4U0S0A8_9ACTN|nr:hypothetical protein [Actinacidiphila oryziradicis]TKA02176.1 hypothetical protein FCI23_38680 [Actinacidiphila oryziradicis]